jgi:hypothetical protein
LSGRLMLGVVFVQSSGGGPGLFGLLTGEVDSS